MDAARNYFRLTTDYNFGLTFFWTATGLVERVKNL
jgi:hypothetical protein